MVKNSCAECTQTVECVYRVSYTYKHEYLLTVVVLLTDCINTVQWVMVLSRVSDSPANQLTGSLLPYHYVRVTSIWLCFGLSSLDVVSKVSITSTWVISLWLT